MKKPLFPFVIATLAASCFACRAAVITVNTTNNVNPLPLVETSLQQALTNLHEGDTIQFSIPGPGPHYIKTPDAGYPIITNHNVTLDGYSQTNAWPNTNSILAPNNANLQIVLDSRDGPEQRTRLGSLNNSGFYDFDSAMLAVLGAKNFTIRGVSFLSRHTAGTSPDPANQDPGDPEIYCIALISDATHARISGCWFGLDPNGTTVAGGRSAVAAFKDAGGASASGLVFGTDGDGQNDPAEFNISMGMGLALNLETPDVKVAGNFINVFPNGTTFPNLSTIAIHDGQGIEAIQNGAADNMIIGTDGDGVGDANERNVLGPVFYPSRATYAKFWGPATNVIFAGNYVGVGINGQAIVGKRPADANISLIGIRSFSSVRIGSNLDGASDALEGNLIYNLGCQDPAQCGPTTRAFIDLDDSNNDNGGADAARILARGNTLVNNASAVLMQDQNVTLATYYSGVFAESTNQFITTLATNASGTQLRVAVPPPNTDNYSTVIVDFYAVDPVGLTNAIGQTNAFVRGQPLGSVIDNSPQDLDPTTNNVAFDISNLNLTNKTTVTALATCSQDPGLATQAGRAVTAIFSNPVTVTVSSAPLRITSFSYANGNVTFTLSGGTPPFQVQARTNLTTDSWADFGLPFNNGSAVFPASSVSQSFFRVRSQ